MRRSAVCVGLLAGDGAGGTTGGGAVVEAGVFPPLPPLAPLGTMFPAEEHVACVESKQFPLQEAKFDWHSCVFPLYTSIAQLYWPGTKQAPLQLHVPVPHPALLQVPLDAAALEEVEAAFDVLDVVLEVVDDVVGALVDDVVEDVVGAFVDEVVDDVVELVEDVDAGTLLLLFDPGPLASCPLTQWYAEEEKQAPLQDKGDPLGQIWVFELYKSVAHTAVALL